MLNTKKLKMKTKTIILFIMIVTIFGCNKSTTIENTLINNSNNYWVYYNPKQTGYIYFKFNDNGSVDKYTRDLKGEFLLFNSEGDIVNNNRVWSISKDSILNWSGHKYDIVNYNERVIVLLYEDKKSKLQKNIFLVKEEKDKFRNSTYYYEQKRKNNPAKYVKQY